MFYLINNKIFQDLECFNDKYLFYNYIKYYSISLKTKGVVEYIYILCLNLLVNIKSTYSMLH